MEEKDIAIQITGLKKRYRLGTIGGGTLANDLQSWWARVRHKEDPNSRIGSKVYGKNETFMALNGIDLTVYKGERVGIIGHNGAGKSTLLKLLSRVTGPTEGEIKLDGRISSMLEVGTGFNGELTGRENIYLNGAILGMTKAEIDGKIDKIIEFSECGQFIDTPVKRYSSGMYVKLAFAVASHLDSEILIMDEVLAVGDMAFQKKCLDKMSQVSQDEGRTILYVSHNMNTIRRLCDRCIVMDHGKIIFNGDVEEAIGLYLNNSDEYETQLPKFYDLSAVERVAEKFSVSAKILEFEFLEKETPEYIEGESLKFRLKWEAYHAIDEIGVRAAIKRSDETNVGLAEAGSFLCVEGAGIFDQTYSLDIGNLAPGLYFMKVHLYTRNASNTIVDIDAATLPVYFRITEDVKNRTTWLGNFWGSVRLNDIVLLENNKGV